MNDTTDPRSDPQLDDRAAIEFARAFAREALDEQRRARRWSVFFRMALLLYLLLLLIASAPALFDFSFGSDEHTAVVEIKGIIADDREASADNVVRGLREAFEDDRSAGLILRINSPGGSPVQAGYINDEIRRLREERPELPVYAVIVDICASGGYYIAAAADEIYADKASIVGSIGVRMDGFGFTEAMAKLGVERRLLTAGEHKGFLDPFQPLQSEEVEHVRELLEQMHEQFIRTVKLGRGERLADDESVFSGLVWTGEESLEIGLVDALGSTSYVAREVIGEEELRDFTVRRGYFDRLARQMGAAFMAKLESGWRLR